MTGPTRPNVFTTDAPTVQKFNDLNAALNANLFDQVALLNAANQVVAKVPTLVQAQTATALVGLNSAIAAAQAAQVTDKKFISSTTAMPTAPTSTDLTTYPGDIFGSHLNAAGAVQRVVWDRSNSVWKDNGQPGATKADTDAAALVGQLVQTAVSYPTVAAMSADATLPNALRATAGGFTWVWAASGTVDGIDTVTAAGGGVRLREGSAALPAAFFASPQAALTAATTRAVQDLSGTAPLTVHPNAQLNRARLTQSAANGGSALLLADQTAGTSANETAFTSGRTARVIQGLNLTSDGTGIGLTIGDTANFWSGAIKTVRDSYFRGFQTAIAIKSNTYMLSFDGGTITQGPVGSFGVANDPASVNYGENITFKSYYFFNNAGTCVQLVGGGYGQQLKFVDCSFDYSALAVVVKTGARVILDRCWIETNATSTPAEYLRAEGGAQLLLIDCDFVIGGDWTGRAGFIRNVNAEVVIRGGRLGFSGTAPVQFVNDEAGGVTTVTGLRYSPGTQNRGRFGQSGTLVTTADAALSGSAALSGGTITLTPAGGTAQAVWTVPALPGQTVRFAYKYATNALTVGSQSYMLLSGSLGWYDAAGVQIGANSQILGLHGGTQTTIEAPPEPDMPQIAPARARTARITLTASGAASGTAALSNVECWVL